MTKEARFSNAARPNPLLIFGFVIPSSFVIRISSLDALPTLAGISYGRKTLPEFSLLALGFPLLVRLTRLLLGTGTGRSAADQRENRGHRKKEKN
jgi:hypothetical protein